MTWNFNAQGKVTSYVDPAGVTVTYNYTDGVLTSVTNGLGRTLSFTYTDDRLTSVSDGSREVFYTIDENGSLTEFKDAEEEITTYEYLESMPGVLVKYFLPANPTSPFATNTYDSLFRIKMQELANRGPCKYFFAGARAESVDALGNSHVMYYNSLGSLLRDIDALGNETVYERDGLNREVKLTFPELNSVETVYDNNNNVRVLTQKAKPGSSLTLFRSLNMTLLGTR